MENINKLKGLGGKKQYFCFVLHVLKCLLDMQVDMSSSQAVGYIGLEFSEVVKGIE